MPGFLDSIFSAVGDAFGGGGGDNPFGSGSTFDWGSVDPSSVVGDPFGGGTPFDFGSVAPSTFGITPGAFDPTPGLFGSGPNFDWGSVDPASFGIGPGAFSDVPLPLQTASPPNPAGGVVPGSSPGTALKPLDLIHTLTGGGGTGGGTPTPQSGTAKPGSTPASTNPIQNLLKPGGIIPGMSLPQLLGAIGLGTTALQGPGTPPGLDKLQASTQNNEDLLRGQILPTALANQQGQINGTALNQFERQLQQKQAAIRQSYAGMGESGSSMEAQDLNGARDATQAAIFQAAQGMASTGLQFATSLIGADNTAFNDIMQAQIAQDKEFQDAMAAFAAAAAGTTQEAANATVTAGG